MTLVWASGYNGITDPDAQTYIAAVEAADGQAIEGDVALAINDFVVGCKDDGIWDAIKASCILAGARTLSGALVPLRGAAPTNTNFVSADYDRETGLKGGNGKLIDSNRSDAADPLDNFHASAYVTEVATALNNGFYIGSISPAPYTRIQYGGSNTLFYNRHSTTAIIVSGKPLGFVGFSRDNSSNYDIRMNSNDTVATKTSASTPSTNNYTVLSSTSNNYVNARLSFYSIGESIDLEQLDNRTTRLMNLISYSLASGLPDLSTMDLDAASYIGAVYRAGGTLS